MLGYLQGRLKHRDSGEAMILVGVENNGCVGYLVRTPEHSRYEALLPGQTVELFIYTHVREDALDLFGFLNSEEKRFFTTLLSVSGVGPKMALSLLSHADESSLMKMILDEDKAALTNISGVGKKTAERIILELKDKVEKKFNSKEVAKGELVPANQLFIEAYLALQGLGYKEQQAKLMIEQVLKSNPNQKKVEEVIRQALQGGRDGG